MPLSGRLGCCLALLMLPRLQQLRLPLRATGLLSDALSLLASRVAIASAPKRGGDSKGSPQPSAGQLSEHLMQAQQACSTYLVGYDGVAWPPQQCELHSVPNLQMKQQSSGMVMRF